MGTSHVWWWWARLKYSFSGLLTLSFPNELTCFDNLIYGGCGSSCCWSVRLVWGGSDGWVGSSTCWIEASGSKIFRRPLNKNWKIDQSTDMAAYFSKNEQSLLQTMMAMLCNYDSKYVMPPMLCKCVKTTPDSSKGSVHAVHN